MFHLLTRRRVAIFPKSSQGAAQHPLLPGAFHQPLGGHGRCCCCLHVVSPRGIPAFTTVGDVPPALWAATGASALSQVFSADGPSPPTTRKSLTCLLGGHRHHHLLFISGRRRSNIYCWCGCLACLLGGQRLHLLAISGRGGPSICCHRGCLTAFLTTLLCIFHLRPGRVLSLPTIPFIISFIVFLVGLVTTHRQVRIFLLVFFSIYQEGGTPAVTALRDFLAVLSSEQPQLGVATSTQHTTGASQLSSPPGTLWPPSGQPRGSLSYSKFSHHSSPSLWGCPGRSQSSRRGRCFCARYLHLVETLQPHMILTMSHWASGLTCYFPPQGSQVQIPWGDLCETGILLLALSCYLGDPNVIDHQQSFVPNCH
jgi:hypothetical protein